jgi:hypothetical protein
MGKLSGEGYIVFQGMLWEQVFTPENRRAALEPELWKLGLVFAPRLNCE